MSAIYGFYTVISMVKISFFDYFLNRKVVANKRLFIVSISKCERNIALQQLGHP